MPMVAKTPIAATGASSAETKESRPPAVVRLVRQTARPECPSAWAMAASRLSPAS